MDLFFKSYIPPHEKEDDYEFSCDEIFRICQESLQIMFSQYDEFADSLCRNLAKSIYLICGKNYNS